MSFIVSVLNDSSFEFWKFEASFGLYPPEKKSCPVFASIKFLTINNNGFSEVWGGDGKWAKWRGAERRVQEGFRFSLAYVFFFPLLSENGSLLIFSLKSYGTTR